MPGLCECGQLAEQPGPVDLPPVPAADERDGRDHFSGHTQGAVDLVPGHVVDLWPNFFSFLSA